MSNRVATVSIDAVAAGEKLSVHEATISLGVNSIPSVELICAPDLGKAIPLIPEVRSHKISEYAKLYRDLSKKAESLDQIGRIKITIKYDDGEEDGVTLQGWVLASVGLSGVGSTSAPYLSVIMQHPICRLTKVGSIYETPKSEMARSFNSKVTSTGDFLEVMTDTYTFLRNGVNYYPTPDPKAQEFRDNLGVGKYDPNEYLKFKKGSGENTGIFLGGSLGDAKIKLAQAIGRMIASSSIGGTSTWDTIVGSAGPLLLSITQDQEDNFTKDSLVLEPTKPWKEVTIVLDEEMCTSIDLPGMNPFRLAGVMARKLGPFNTSMSKGIGKNGNPQTDELLMDILHAPVGPSIANGRIMKVEAPNILESMFRRDSTTGGTIPKSERLSDAYLVNSYNDALKKYCQATYEISAMSMVRANVTMALRLHDDQSFNLILPGNTCKVRSGYEDIYFAYINKVVHHITTSGENCTNVALSYVRPDRGLYIGGEQAIAADAPNAAYT